MSLDILCTDCLQKSTVCNLLSGTSVPRDYVEFPSQINEHAALDPMVLKKIMRYIIKRKKQYQALIDKIKKS
jgi:peptidyl-dipeptidase Dcp